MKKAAIITFFIFFAYIPVVHGATIFFDPQESTVGPGQPFKVGMTIDSVHPINTLSIAIDIPYTLEVIDISDGNSAINFWVDRPHVNNDHQLVFAGIIPGGFVGTHAKVLTFTLKASQEGAFTIGLDPASYAYQNTSTYTVEDLSASKLELMVVSGRENIVNTIPDNDPPESFTPLITQLTSSLEMRDGEHQGLWYVTFQTQDKGSGINRYEVAESYNTISTIDRSGLDALSWREAENPYLLTDQERTSFVYVRAIDDVGNIRTEIISPLRTRSWYERIHWYILVALVIFALLFMKSKYTHRIVSVLLFGIAIFGSISFVDAATLSVVPASATGAYSVGQVFSVPVLVSTVGGDPLNAVSGVISFPASILQVVSIDKSGSIIDFWIGDPAYSNSEGSISFEGGSYNPGFSGAGGKVINILFKAKTTGSATLSFVSSSVLANDGRGTNILDHANPTTITISSKQTTPDDIADTVANQSLSVYSSTHPDPIKWYSLTKALISWKLPKGANAVRTKLDQNPSTIPSVLYSPAITEKEVEITKDGVWYFHVQARDDSGWGSVSHFKMQIDTTPPNTFDITFPHGLETTDPRPVILFNTTDSLSGISHYDVAVGGANAIRVPSETVESNPYAVPDQEPGERAVKVVAYDRAGNSTYATGSFVVEGLKAPQFEDLADTITEGDNLQFTGSTYPKAVLTVYLKDENGNTESQSTTAGQAAGRFLMVWKKYLPHGTYSMTAQIVDEHGARSSLTPEKLIKVKLPAINRIGLPFLNYLTLIAIVITALAGLVAWVWYLTHHLRRFKKKLNTKIKKADERIHADFKKLIKTVSAQIKILQRESAKRMLTAEEAQLVGVLREALKETEEDVERDVREIGE